MNSLQKSYNAFIDSVCTELGCSELARPFREGYSVLCEGARKTVKYDRKKFRDTISVYAEPIARTVNEFFGRYGLGITIVDPESWEDHFIGRGDIALNLRSMQVDPHFAPVVINEKLIAKYYFGDWYEDDDILIECLSDSLWHEAGHLVFSYIDDTMHISFVSERQEEDIVEDFALYMTEETLDVPWKHYSEERVRKLKCALKLIDVLNSPQVDMSALPEIMELTRSKIGTERKLLKAILSAKEGI